MLFMFLHYIKNYVLLCIRCDCDTGYTGTVCDRVVTVCDPSPCQNGASCVIEIDNSYTCQCQQHYMGRECQTYINEVI